MDRWALNVWKSLALREDLPEAAVPTVVAALTRPVVPAPTGEAEWVARDQEAALGKALGNLLSVAVDPALRAAVIAAAPRASLVAAFREGKIPLSDLEAVVAAHGVWDDLVIKVSQEGLLPRALELLEQLSEWDAQSVVVKWGKRSPIPAEIVDGLVRQAVASVSAALADPAAQSDWTLSRHNPLYNNWPSARSGAAWHLLEAIPEHWGRLLTHPDLKASVAHLLLDQGAELPDSVLAACAPYTLAPELEGVSLPQPSLLARHRLHLAAARVRRHPGLLDLIRDDLAKLCDQCVRTGRLLVRPHGRGKAGDLIPLVVDLALISGNTPQMEKAAQLLMELPEPNVLVHAPRHNRFSQEEVIDSPGSRLESNLQHRRAEALAALASNSRCDKMALTEMVAGLHPAEQDWLAHHAKAPDWFKEAAGALAPASEDTTAVPRMVSDDDLDQHPDPGSVLVTWLEAARDELSLDSRYVYARVLTSRHLTSTVLCQVPFREVIGASEEVREPLLLRLCGSDPDRWAALEAAIEERSIDHDHTVGHQPFSEVLDVVDVHCAPVPDPA